MYLLEDCIEKLLNTLSEQPVDQGSLWVANWGGSGQVPENVARIAKDIRGATQSRTILVHGRYGSGKSSFMKSIRTQIEHPPEGDEHKAMTLWLDMPSLTSHIDSTALAAVMIRIAETLQDEFGDSGQEVCNFGQALEDLWRIEARAMHAQCSDPCDMTIPPEPSRMAGTVRGEGRRYVKANTLERQIEKSIKSLGKKTEPEEESKIPLVVFLDDLDRCERRVAMDVVRLLLRFGSVSNVHFVLACDWDVLEQGVKDWMHQHGKADDGAPLVTANSALEKYIHIPVELPWMGMTARAGAVPRAELSPLMRNVLELKDGIVTDSHYEQACLYDVFVNTLMSEECRDAK